MRHTNYLLRPLTIDNAKPRDKAYALTDGGGLLLEVLPSGTKTWRFKYHLNGKREKVTIGAYPAYTIKQARDRHEELRALVERGESPAKTKQSSMAARKVAESRDLTVRVFARRWVDETLFYRSPAYVAQIVRWLDAYIDPAIGDMQLADVQPGDVLAIIKARAVTPVTAERIRVIVQQFYNHAIRNLLVTTNPAQPLRGAIPRAPVEHHRHLSEKELGAFWRKLDDQGAHITTIAATKLLLLTMTRKSELLRSKWHEFDLDSAQWDIPADRMKMGKPHRVFLSAQATAGGRGMGAIAAHLRYIAKAGRLPIEDDRGAVREGREALRAIADQWRFGGTRIPEVSERREAFNIMLSMPAGTDARVLRQAAREFAKAELVNHRYVMVLHTHQANPHVHISVRAEGRDGKRLNPRKEDLRRWRETFAERLRAWGIEAEATSQAVRGSRHRDERVWSRKKVQGRVTAAGDKQKLPHMSPSHRRPGEAWARIAQALAASPEPSDRDLSSAIVRYVREMPVVRAVMARSTAQRELPGMTRSPAPRVTPTWTGPEMER